MTSSSLSRTARAVGLALLVIVGIAGYLALETFWRREDTSAGSATAPPEEREEVVCFGFVDLENGVASLAPLAPGRVTRLLAREGSRVAAGQGLLQLDD